MAPERVALGLLLRVLAAPTRAEDEDRALQAFARPASAARGAPVEALEWERRLRPADRLGPPPLRAADAALLSAARTGRWADALKLVKTGGAAANARDDAGGHALVPAARAGQDELVRELVKRGADLDRIGDDGFHALGAAAFAGQRSTVRLLLLAGADPSRFTASGQSALHLAALAGRLDILRELLRMKVDVDTLNRQRETALDVAANAGQVDAMGLLIDAGADPLRAGNR